MSTRKPSTRRDFIKTTGQTTVALGTLDLVSRLNGFEKYATSFNSILNDLVLSNKAHALVGSPSTAHRLIVVYANGGLDDKLGNDPVTNEKLFVNGVNNSAGYHYRIDANGYRYGFSPEWERYSDRMTPVAGKSNLVVGPGLKACALAGGAFQIAPTAFVNGLYNQITSHEIAKNYLVSGRISASTSRTYPSYGSLLSTTIPSFPAHFVLGSGDLPHSWTRTSSPPFAASNLDRIPSILGGPNLHSTSDRVLSAQSVQALNELSLSIDAPYIDQLPTRDSLSANTWRQMGEKIDALYARRLYERMRNNPTNDPSISTRYNYGSDMIAPEAMLAAGFMALREGVRAVTVQFNVALDSHNDVFDGANNNAPSRNQANEQRRLARALNALVSDLVSTDDPDVAGKKLIETTTVVIASEFTRTPFINSANGTDHWDVASYIVMGAGVQDNTRIGSTGIDGKALGWDRATRLAVPRTEATQILPEHFAAALLRHFGLNQFADEITTAPLGGIFGSTS